MRLTRTAYAAVVVAACLGLVGCGSSSKTAAPPAAVPTTGSFSPTPYPGVLPSMSTPPPALNQADALARFSLRDMANAEEIYFTDSQVYTLQVAKLTQYGLAATDTANVVILSVHGGDTFCLKATTAGTTSTWYYEAAHGGVTTTPCT